MHILFLAHDSSRTGAPIVLLHFMRWLKKNTTIQFSILLKIPGGIEQEMREIAPVYLYPELLNNPAMRRDIMKHISIIYGNNVGVHDMLDALQIENQLIIIHVHELQYAIDFFQGEKLWRKYEIARYIAASNAVKQNLMSNHRIAEKKISVVYESIPKSDVKVILEKGPFVRKHLGIAPDDIVVGACGSVDWRKGPDLFVDTASHLQQMQLGRKIHFIWLGAPFDNAYMRQIRYDIKKRGLIERVRFIGPRLNPLDYIGSFDIFLMTSREDPFPLVVLEAASLQKPILCFANAGGVPEFVTPDIGYVVPYGDTNELATKIQELVTNPSVKESMGTHAQERFLKDFDIDHVAPQLVGVIKSVAL